MGISVTINLNGTIISDFTIMISGIIWRDMTVSGSDFWYSHTWNPAIVVILDMKRFWTSWPSNWDIISSRNFIYPSLPSHRRYLKLGRNAIIISLGSVEYWGNCLCDYGIRGLIIESSITVSIFNPFSILCLIIKLRTVIFLEHYNYFWFFAITHSIRTLSYQICQRHCTTWSYRTFPS